MRFDFPSDAKTVEWVAGCDYPDSFGGQMPLDNPLYRFHELPPDNKMMKFYLREPVKEGLCSVIYPLSKIKAELFFDPMTLPYLGLWITTGGYRGERNFAFEPATAYYDTWSCAEMNGRIPILEPGQSVMLNMGIRVIPI